MKNLIFQSFRRIFNLAEKIASDYHRWEDSHSDVKADVESGFPRKKKRPEASYDSKLQSMKDSQGKSDFSGSGYNGPGNVDHEKIHSNKSQRNF